MSGTFEHSRGMYIFESPFNQKLFVSFSGMKPTSRLLLLCGRSLALAQQSLAALLHYTIDDLNGCG